MKHLVHALRTPCPINDLQTECGMKVTKRTSAKHSLAMNPAEATCVPCSRVVAAKEELERVRNGLPEKGADKYYDWAFGSDSGTSSKTIVAALTSARVLGSRPSVPLDPSDFGRCFRMLSKFPELRPRLSEVADKHPIWRKLVEAWPELECLWNEESPTGQCPKLYARMQELQP